jgi:hypothetical protein
LGMVNFYRSFLPSIARTLRPLTDALLGGRKGADRLEWSAAMEAAFAAAKQSLLTATHLAHPTVWAKLSVVVDASATHVGACLQQRLSGKKVWQFHAIHDVAHPGIRATRRMLSACFVWKGVGKDVAAMCRAFQQCQRGKVHKQPTAPVQAIPV